MRVLVIEDEHKIANALKKVLQQDHYAVDVSYDGDDGYAMATTEPYDLAIVDLMLPGKYNGIDIIKAVRSQGIHIPIIILTAKGSLEDKVGGLNAGADDYLVKPFAMDELLARMHALLRRPTDQQSSVLQVGDLTLDTVSYEIKRGDTPIRLTSKEFAMLEYMMRNPGRPLSKDSIISHVWDYDADVLPNTIEVYIRYIRQKIDEPFDKPLIHTARGFGYSIKA